MDSKVKDDHSLMRTTLDLMLQAGKLLFANGQTTERIMCALKELATAGGFKPAIFVEWGQLRVHLDNGFESHSEAISVEPAGVDMNKVNATMSLIHRVDEGT
ncbi:MAG: hypothetical protein C5B58_07050, partial [Acidobacteria bacterium]